jgi:crotonobetainyl-CoA:carnitine CoA-transferase CaiB-like acyl-CoA transferase
VKHLRVLLHAPDLAAGYAARLLRAAGADVVVLESARGSRLRPGRAADPGSSARAATWAYLAGGWRSAETEAIDLDAAHRWADLVVSSVDGDPDEVLARHERISSVNPAAVHLVTSGFGLTGPYRAWRHTTLVDWAAGGHMYVTGDPEREPLQGGGPWDTYVAGATAAIGAQAAVIDAVRTGRGQLVDVSVIEAAASMHQWTVTMYTHTGCIKRRWGNRFGESVHPIALYECADGWISIVTPALHQWEQLCIAADMVELLADSDLESTAVRFDRSEEIDVPLARWLRDQSVASAVDTLQAVGVPASRVLTMAEVLDEEQLAVREFWDLRPELGEGARVPGAPVELGGARALGSAPALGAHTSDFIRELRDGGGDRPPLPAIDLSAIRFVEVGIAWAGPLAGRFLADLGAEVVKLEHPTSRGISQRTDLDPDWEWGRLPAAHLRFPVFPNAEPGERWWNRMGIFNKMNRNKRSLCMDAKAGPAAERAMRALLERVDGVVHNLSPRGAASLGLDAASVSAVNPNAVTVAMSGYGSNGPLAGFLSYGPVLQAHAGFDEATGYASDEGPTRLGVAYPDGVAGLHGAYAALAALWERELRSAAVHVDLSQLETLLAIAGDALLTTSITGVPPQRHGNRSTEFAPQGVVRCAGDDRWLAFSVQGDREWRSIVGIVGGELVALADLDLAGRMARQDVLLGAVAAWAAGLEPVEAARALQSGGVAAFPVMRNSDLVEDEHLQHRGFVVEWDQTDVGLARFPGFPIHFGAREVELRTCPGLGADNDEVLTRVVGLDPAAIEELWASGALADRPPT